MILGLGKKKILIVDDDESVRRSTAMVLETWNFSVSEAIDGAEAVKLVQSIKPDLIILDNNLPKLSGFDVCKLVKENPKTRAIPILMFSGMGKTGEVNQGFQSGADDYLIKPVDMDRLKAKISSLLGIRLP